MNFLDVRSAAAGATGLEVRLDETLAVSTRVDPAEAGRAAALGIRCEAVRVTGAGQGDCDGVVDVLERLGDRALLHVRLASGQSVIASEIAQTKLRVGDRIGLKFDGDKAHLFTPEGVALPLRGAP